MRALSFDVCNAWRTWNWETLKLRTVVHYLCGDLAGTTKYGPKLQGNVKSGFFCVFGGGCWCKNSLSVSCADLENRSFLLIIVYVGCGYFSVVVVVFVFVVFSLVLIIVLLHPLEGLITAVQMWIKLKLSDSLADSAITMFVVAEW